jgi:hypothetical protein
MREAAAATVQQLLPVHCTFGAHKSENKIIIFIGHHFVCCFVCYFAV